jgi:ParB family chromosome partitioning protein
MSLVKHVVRANATEQNGTAMGTLELPIDAIHVGNRVRKDFGDIAGLAASLKEVGLLQPVAVAEERGEYVLVAGHRRLLAARKAGWKTVPVHVVDLGDVLLGQYHENAFRKNLLPSEMVELYRSIKDRLASPRGRPRKGGKFPAFPRGKTVDKVGKFCGVSGRTLAKMIEIVEAAEENPDKYGQLVEQLDRSTNRVQKVYNRCRRLKLSEMPGPKSSGKVICGLVEEVVRTFGNACFDAVIADPDWNLGLTYNAVYYPRIDPEDYWAGWLEPIYTEFMRILRPGGFLALVQPQAHYPYFGSWFSRDFRVYISCYGFPGKGDASSPLVPAHTPVIVQWKPGTRIPCPYPRKRSFDYFVSNGVYSPLARLHPCPRPLDQLESLIENFVLPGARVLDAFAGAGTCSVACKRLGREFLAVEKDRDFCNLIERRLKEEC